MCFTETFEKRDDCFPEIWNDDWMPENEVNLLHPSRRCIKFKSFTKPNFITYVNYEIGKLVLSKISLHYPAMYILRDDMQFTFFDYVYAYNFYSN